MLNLKSSGRWSFVRHLANGKYTWLWQRFSADTRVEKTSEPHPTYGKVLMSALGNGFRPGLDDYSMDLPSGRMHFPPGRRPQFVSDNQPTTKRPRTKGSASERPMKEG